MIYCGFMHRRMDELPGNSSNEAKSGTFERTWKEKYLRKH